MSIAEKLLSSENYDITVKPAISFKMKLNFVTGRTFNHLTQCIILMQNMWIETTQKERYVWSTYTSVSRLTLGCSLLCRRKQAISVFNMSSLFDYCVIY